MLCKLVFAALVHYADIHLTWIGLSRGFPEGNPILAYLIHVWGFWPAAAFGKTVGMIASYLLLRLGYTGQFWFLTWLTLILGPFGWSLILFG